MTRIRRATASVKIEEEDTDIVQQSLANDDGDSREIIGALLSVFSSNDTLSEQTGVTAVWSSQANTGTGIQQGLQVSAATASTGTDGDEARAGPFLVADSSGRDGTESGLIAETTFGRDAAWIPWPDGGEVHLLARGANSNHNGYRINGILYYEEQTGSL